MNRRFGWLVGLTILIWGCSDDEAAREVAIAERLVAFDGAAYTTQSDKIAHGRRLASVLACSSCHLADYTGANFGEMFPVVDGLWATNIALSLPDLSDQELEEILRHGRRSDRELYLMPSKQTHFLADADMQALIAYLRTIEPKGSPTPSLPEGFAGAVAQRLPNDYWREQEYGRRFYPSAQDEVNYYIAHRVPDLGAALARGRYLATTVCSACHGAALDGQGENSGDIQAVQGYDAETFDALLARDIARDGLMPANEWGGRHSDYPLTHAEREDVYDYVLALAISRQSL